MKRVLLWLIAGTRGGKTRALIIKALHEKPLNPNQLAEKLNLDYKTIRHHLEVLLDNGIIVSQGEGYGAIYFLTEKMEENFDLFLEILGKA